MIKSISLLLRDNISIFAGQEKNKKNVKKT